MCGIGGMLGSPDLSIGHRMNALQAHRGPDGNDVWSDDNVMLAHTRLAIVDIEGSHQPLLGPDGTTLVVNGEIYNHLDLKRLLPPYPYTTMGDSETILALHRSNQAKTSSPLTAQDHANWIGKMEGMYALALWDSNEKQLILARDPLGIKPLVKTMVEGSLIFSSEVKGLRADERHIPELDTLALSARVAWEYPLDATTLLKGVHQVRPGTVETWMLDETGHAIMTGIATIENQALTPDSAWDPSSQAPILLDSFITSVQQRLMADVPVGIVLSGGLDSSLVAAVANEAAQRAEQPVPACWTVAEDEHNPDWIAAERVAQHFDLEHHQHILDPEAFHQSLPDLVWHGEDLDVTVLFFQPLFKTMAQKVKVGLCGQGADELHAGYPRYRNLPMYQQEIQRRMMALPTSDSERLMNGPLNTDDGWFQSTHQPAEHLGSLQSCLEFEMNHGQLSNFQLRLVDRHSMAHSLEVRVPFLGGPHRRQAAQLPMDWRLPDSLEEKAALRAAADLTGLPKDIVRRPKMPAGRATSPTMLSNFLNEHRDVTAQLMTRYKPLAKSLAGQEELALGLGLFEALHIMDGGRYKKVGSVDDLLTEVMN